jgi:hypothetical protein
MNYYRINKPKRRINWLIIALLLWNCYLTFVTNDLIDKAYPTKTTPAVQIIESEEQLDEEMLAELKELDILL